MKTKVFNVIAAVALLFTLGSCAGKTGKAEVQGPRILVAYFSQGGNTQTLATLIHDSIGGDIFAIEPETPYPSEGTHDAVQKQIDEGVLPTLKGNVENLDSYDVIFVGTPNWFGSVALPVKAFLQSNQLAGKKVVPFATFGGGAGNCLTEIAELCPNSTILEGYAVSGDDVRGKPNEVKENVSTWLNNIKTQF